MKNWICEDRKCGWKGTEPSTIPAFEFLGVDEENCEEEDIEICPKCNKLALKSLY